MRFRRSAGNRQGVAAGMTGTVVIHGLAVVAVLFGARSPGPAPIIYSVELVAAPLRPATRTAPPAAVPAPPAPPKVDPKPTPSKKTAPIKKTETPKKVDPKTEPAPPTKTPNQPVAGATPSTGTDVDNVSVQGVAFPYPEYLRNLTNEILRRWARPTGTALEAEISFTINRDGSVRDIKVTRPSGSYSFNLEAQGAVEQAAADRAFGPLPRGWTSDILQIAFLFKPRNRP